MPHVTQLTRRTSFIRRDATLHLVPYYPASVAGLAIRITLSARGRCLDIVRDGNQWSQWLGKLVALKLLLPVADGRYSRPRTASDWQYQYKRRRKVTKAAVRMSPSRLHVLIKRFLS